MYNPRDPLICRNINKSYDQMIEGVDDYPPRERAKLSAFIWWRLCEEVPVEDIQHLKENVSYELTGDMSIDETYSLLLDYGFSPDYVEEQMKSSRNEIKRKKLKCK